MRDSCRIAAEVLQRVCEMVAPGVSTQQLDEAAAKFMAEAGAKSACYQYRIGNRTFPSHTCLSVNEEVVHGIGRPDRILQLGDSITVDVCVMYNGYIGDNARTVPVGPVAPEIQRLLKVTEDALYLGIEKAHAGNKVRDIAATVQDFVERNQMTVVREFVGHGVGRSMHEEPQVPNYRTNGTGKKLQPGMTIAIEPMVNLGRSDIEVLSDGWTAVTRDRSPSAHFEHTVLITTSGPEILTKVA